MLVTALSARYFRAALRPSDWIPLLLLCPLGLVLPKGPIYLEYIVSHPAEWRSMGRYSDNEPSVECRFMTPNKSLTLGAAFAVKHNVQIIYGRWIDADSRPPRGSLLFNANANAHLVSLYIFRLTLCIMVCDPFD